MFQMFTFLWSGLSSLPALLSQLYVSGGMFADSGVSAKQLASWAHNPHSGTTGGCPSALYLNNCTADQIQTCGNCMNGE